MDLSFTKAMDAAGKVFQVPVACTKTDNKISVLIKKEDITGAAQVDILPQLSDTPCGEGYFAVPMLHRSYLTYFKPRQDFCEDTLLFSQFNIERNYFLIMFGKGKLQQRVYSHSPIQ